MTNGIQVGVAIVVLAGVVGAGLYFVRPDADLDVPAARLESVLEEAKGWGFVMTAKELNRPLPSDNAASDIQRLVALNETDTKLSARIGELRRLAQSDTIIAKTKLEPFSHQLQAVEAACAHADVGFERDWDLGLTMTLDELGAYRVGARLLATRAEIRAADGDKEGAFADLGRMATLGRFARSELVIVGALSASAIYNLRYGTIRRLAILWKDDPAALAELKELIGLELPPPPIAEIGRREAYAVLSLVRNFREFGGQAAFVTETNERSQVRVPADPSALKRSGLPEGKFERANLATTLMYWNTLIPKVRERPLDALALKRVLDQATLEVKGDGSRARSIIREVILPPANFLQLFGAETYRRMTLVYLDAFITRAKTGHFPTQAVNPLRDPYASRDLRYKAGPDTLKIWSCGVDLMDNGGERRNGQAQYDEVIEYPPPAPQPPGTVQGPARPAF